MGADGKKKRSTSKVAVIAHAGKTFGGGLLELRRELARQGIVDPLWLEVQKSKAAPREVKRALGAGAELIFVWGGDGTVQRCIDVVAGSDAALAILPAGTANLFATNLDIPQDIQRDVAIGLYGNRRKLDVGRFNGERFGVMAGAGFDASMIHAVNGGLKDRFGRVAYVWTGSKSLRAKPFRAKIAIDGTSWYSGAASCILVGNVGRLFGGVEVFDDARPDDGRLEIGVVNADGVGDWARVLARTVVGHADTSPLVRATTAKKIKVELDRKVLYEVDGGDRVKVRRFTIKVEPKAVTVCVPNQA
jgi:diacylglycerol kinase (ATP)